MIEFGEKIKRLREEKGMTQQTMAECLYVTRQAVSRWECGARYPDLLTAKKIADVLETTVDELLSGEELKRDVEKEPILTTSVSNFIQTALYAFGAVSYLIAVINLLYAGISEKSFVYWENGSRFAYNIIFFFSYCMIFIAMALGVWYSVRNELSSKRTGIIMSAEFLKNCMLLFGAYLILPENNVKQPLGWYLLFGNIAVIVIINKFFACKRHISPIPIYVIVGVLLLMEMWKFCQMLISPISLGAYGDALRFTVLIISALEQAAVFGLLICQAYVLHKKRQHLKQNHGKMQDLLYSSKNSPDMTAARMLDCGIAPLLSLCMPSHLCISGLNPETLLQCEISEENQVRAKRSIWFYPIFQRKNQA